MNHSAFRSFRAGAWILGALALAQSQAFAQGSNAAPITAVDEIHTIERVIEERVGETLQSVVGENKFAVYAHVEINPDGKLLQEYQEERMLRTMPGLPGSDGVDAPSNKLFSMIRNRKIIVVLDKSVPAEQELVVKDVLQSKLGIDSQKGDSLEIRRSEIASPLGASSSDGASSVVKPWVLAVAAGILLALGFCLWQLSLMKERLNSRAQLKADVEATGGLSLPPLSVQPGQASSGADSPDSDSGEEAAGSASTSHRTIAPAAVISAAELKEKIMAMAVSNPQACAIVTRKLLVTREGMRKLAVTCEAIGFEYAKRLFDSIGPAKWRALSEYLRENLAEITNANSGQILLETYTDILCEAMGSDPSQNVDDPFDFLRKLSDSELLRLLAAEQPANVAMIAAFWEAEEMSKILSLLNEQARNQVVVQIARLQGLPKEVVRQAAISVAEQLKAIRARTEVEVDGSQVVARVLGLVDNKTEDELLRFLEVQDPAARERLRSYYFSFDSIPMLPGELIEELCGKLDPSVITAGLTAASETIIEAMLAPLAPKQRAIVEDDVRLNQSQKVAAGPATFEARKTIVHAARQMLKEKGIELSSILNKPSPDSGQATAQEDSQPEAKAA